MNIFKTIIFLSFLFICHSIAAFDSGEAMTDAQMAGTGYYFSSSSGNDNNTDNFSFALAEHGKTEPAD